MKTKLLWTLALVSAVFQSSFAQSPDAAVSPSSGHSKIKFTLAPQLSYTFGYTEYIMDISIPTDTGLYVLKSKLEFPLDVVMAGVRFGAHSTEDKLYAWSVESGYLTNLNDPGGVMKDHDWETVQRGRVEKTSYTESQAEMNSTLLTFEATVRVYHQKNFNLALWGGFRYHKIEQDVIGAEGWGLDPNFVRRPKSTTKRAGFYRVSYKSPHIGLHSNIKLGARARFGVRAAFAPVWVSDFDDHLLRYKTATSSITGSGFISRAKIHIDLANNTTAKPFVSLTGDLVYLHASGSQTQRWYGDDPATPDLDDTGKVLPGIPHEINSLQGSVGLRIGVTF